MKPDALVLLLASLAYTAALAALNIGGEQVPATAYGVAFLGMLLLGGIALITIRSLRRDLRELGGGSA